MIIKVIQESRGENKREVATYCYECDSYVFIQNENPRKQCVVIFKDGRQIESFTNPIFNRFFVCNNNGKTIDTIEFSPIKKGE